MRYQRALPLTLEKPRCGCRHFVSPSRVFAKSAKSKLPSDGWTMESFNTQNGAQLIRDMEMVQRAAKAKGARLVTKNLTLVMRKQITYVLELVSASVNRYAGIAATRGAKASTTITMQAAQHGELWAQALNDAFRILGREVEVTMQPAMQSVADDILEKNTTLLTGGKPSVASKRVMQQSVNEIAREVTRIDTTTKTRLARVISDGIDAGLSPAALMEDVRTKIPQIATNRVPTIVRTEMGRVADRAAVRSMKDSNVVTHVSVTGCEAIEPGIPTFRGVPTCNIKNVPIEYSGDLRFHINHTGAIIASAFRQSNGGTPNIPLKEGTGIGTWEDRGRPVPSLVKDEPPKPTSPQALPPITPVAPKPPRKPKPAVAPTLQSSVIDDLVNTIHPNDVAGGYFVRYRQEAYFVEQGFTPEEFVEFNKILEGHTRDATQAASDALIEAALNDPNPNRFKEFILKRADAEEALSIRLGARFNAEAPSRVESLWREFQRDMDRGFTRIDPYTEEGMTLREIFEDRNSEAISQIKELGDSIANPKVYRRGDADKIILSTTKNPKGANTQIGSASPSFIKPDHSWTREELNKKGYRMVAGNTSLYGYVGENEVVFIKIPVSTARPPKPKPVVEVKPTRFQNVPDDEAFDKFNDFLSKFLTPDSAQAVQSGPRNEVMYSAGASSTGGSRPMQVARSISDEKPTFLSREEFLAKSKDMHPIGHFDRGVNFKDPLAALKKDKAWQGTGVYGDGYYHQIVSHTVQDTLEGKVSNTATSYAGFDDSSQIMAGFLSKEAKVVDYHKLLDMRDSFREYLYDLPSGQAEFALRYYKVDSILDINEAQLNAIKTQYESFSKLVYLAEIAATNPGSFARLAGYDAIHVKMDDYLVVVNNRHYNLLNTTAKRNNQSGGNFNF